MKIKYIFKEWEKLRLVYNLVLLIVFSVMSVDAYYFSEWGEPQASFMEIVVHSLVYAFIANTLYLAGPALDSYLCWLEVTFKYKRYVIFAVGLLLSVVLEIGILGVELTPF